MYIYIYVHIYIYVCVCVCKHIYIYVYRVSVCVYVCFFQSLVVCVLLTDVTESFFSKEYLNFPLGLAPISCFARYRGVRWGQGYIYIYI